MSFNDKIDQSKHQLLMDLLIDTGYAEDESDAASIIEGNNVFLVDCVEEYSIVNDSRYILSPGDVVEFGGVVYLFEAKNVWRAIADYRFESEEWDRHEHAKSGTSKQYSISVYISQPMTGVNIENVMSARKQAEEKIKQDHKGETIKFTNSYRPDWAPEFILHLEALSRSLHYLACSDEAYFVPGWEKSKGCRVERLCCELYGIPIVDIEW